MISALVNEERQNMPSDGSQPQGADSKRNQSRQTTRGNRIWTFWARRSVMQRYCIAIVLHHTGVYFFLTSLFLDKLSIRLTSSVIYFLSPAYLFFNMHTPANMMRASPVHQPDPYLTSNLYIWRGRDVRCQMSDVSEHPPGRMGNQYFVFLFMHTQTSDFRRYCAWLPKTSVMCQNALILKQ